MNWQENLRLVGSYFISLAQVNANLTPITKGGIMQEIDALRYRLNNDTDVDRIRLEIADLIAKCLTGNRETLDNWKKEFLVHAIGALKQNICAGHRGSTTLLRLCLTNIEKAHVPPDKRAADYAITDKQIENLTYDQLVDEIRKLGGNIYS